jgi:predicted nuclease of restriction endonuclease-like (RecB) superfamily
MSRKHELPEALTSTGGKREGKAPTNFQWEPPPPESDMAEQILKEPSNFDFLTATEAAKEREIDRGILTHLRGLLPDLGRGLFFVRSKSR